LDLIQEEQQGCNVNRESQVYAVERERDAARGIEVCSIQKNGLGTSISILLIHGTSHTHNRKRRNRPFARNVAEEARHILQRLKHPNVIRRSRQSRRRRSYRLLHKLSRSRRDRTVRQIGLGRLRNHAAARPHHVAYRTGLGEQARQGHEEIGGRREE
jgi:hypothetical protein